VVLLFPLGALFLIGRGVFLGWRWLKHGDARLQLATNGSSAFTLLQPRTRLAPGPNALYASMAGTVTNGAIGHDPVRAVQLGT
jgi:hypothetical protein